MRILLNFREVTASFRLKMHCVPVSRSLDEAKELIEFALANDDVAKQIAKR
jgi:hypothetical protein